MRKESYEFEIIFEHEIYFWVSRTQIATMSPTFCRSGFETNWMWIVLYSTIDENPTSVAPKHHI